MSKIQAAQVIVRLPILPALKQEMKIEKMETAKMTEAEPVPGTSVEPPAAEAEKPAEEPTEEVMIELTAEKKEDEPEEENVNEYFKKYVLTRKGKGPEEKIQEACKKINYQNLVILIAVGDYIVNKAKNIKEVIQCSPACDVQKERAQCRRQTVHQVKKGSRKAGGACHEEPMDRREMYNRTT